MSSQRERASGSSWQFQRQANVPLGLNILVRLVAVVLSLTLVGVVLKLIGMDPLALGMKAIKQTMGTAYGLQQALILATPLVLTGLAVAVGMRMSLWNIGADGQLYLGAFVATAVALNVKGPAPLMVVVVLLAGAAGGALWMLIPALVRAYWNVNEIIMTLLLNFVAVLLVNYFVMGAWRDTGAAILSATPRLPYALPVLGNSYLHIGFIIAILVAILLTLAFQSTRWGYEVRIIGSNRRTAEFAGISVVRNILVVMLLSGALAGLSGAIEVTGTTHRLSGTISNGYGFMGIIVAALADASPLAVLPVGFLLAVLLNAGIVLQTQGLSVNTVLAINGVILIFAAVGEAAAHYRLVRVTPERLQQATEAMISGQEGTATSAPPADSEKTEEVSS